MKLKLKLTPQKGSEIRNSLKKEIFYPSDGYWDGKASRQKEGENNRYVYEYVTGTRKGKYILFPNNTLLFEGHRNSFLSGTMCFDFIAKEDVFSWEIIESQEMGRSPWD